jgi:hypothetical protein
MLFFFRGRSGPIARIAIGVVLAVIGLVIHGGAFFVAFGIVMMVWGATAALMLQRAQRRSYVSSGSSMP